MDIVEVKQQLIRNLQGVDKLLRQKLITIDMYRIIRYNLILNYGRIRRVK